MKSISKAFYLFMVIALLAGMLGMQSVKPVQAASQALRISQAYGAGGNDGATYTHDFIEIYNSSDTAINLTGWSVQYASSAGTSWTVTALTGTIPANSYYLIQEAKGNGGTTPLPTPDATGSTAMQGASNFKIALVHSTTALSGSCPTGVVDFLGGGTANCSETLAAPGTTNPTALIRKQAGCQDTDNNSDDFEVLAPTPRNSASPTHACGPIPPVINEFSASTAGNDVEYVEFFGSPNTDYSAYTLLGIEGDYNASNSSEGFVDNIIPLGTTDANGFFLVELVMNTLENGTISFLLVKDSTATAGVDVDTDDDGVIDVTYWSEVRDGVAVNDGGAGDLTYATPVLGVAYDGLTFAPGGASRIPDGADTDTSADWVRNDFDLAGIPGYTGTIATGEAYNTPGASNQVYIETAPSVVSTNPVNGGNHPNDENITITFSEPVTVTDPWFSIVCTNSGVHSAVVTDADPIYSLNPDVDFTIGESCTVTILAANVVDDDVDDAIYDEMLADYVFTFTAITPPERCGDPFTPTYEIQGTGETSPLAGTVLATEGVVIGDFQVGGKNGYYIQDPTGDGNSATSDGIFVYNTTTNVNVGDHVRVRGTAVEYLGITEISPVTQVWICSTGNTITPTEVTLPVTAVTDFEKYESMLVTFPQSLIISEYFNFDRYGEIVLTSTRHMTPTASVEPGAPAQAAALAYLLDSITLDDGRTSQNPDPAIHPNGLTFDMTNLFRGGGTVTNVTGVMDYYSNLYRVQPTTGADYEDTNPRTETPDITEGDVKIASFNVLNYFVTLDGSGSICGPSSNQECRGADDANEFTRQRAKILSALDAIDADIYGLMEIENDRPGGQDPVADLVAGLNEINGAGTYAYINTGSIGTDAIKQAIIYKPASVTPVGTYKLLTSAVDARFIDTANRPVIAQTFKDNETGTEFVVAVNHLKSKGSACSGDPDTGDGQGNCNLTREAAAQALVDWLANPTYFPDVDKALIIGDLNSYDKEDPIDAIKLGADDTADTDDDFLDMIYEFQGEDAYGYVYDGQTGYLDHALASQAMAEIIADVNFWHINADESDLIDYDTSFKLPAQDLLYAPDAYRSSDHDPVIISLSMNAAPVASDQSVSTAEDTAVEITLGATDPNGDPLTYAIVTDPEHGDVALVDNVATYTPDLNYNGSDSFTFKANDGELDSNTASVSITVTPVNDAPVAADQSASTAEDTAKDITLTATDVDSDNLIYIIVDQPTHGSVSLADAVATYTPDLNYNGSDSFTFKANDGVLDSEIAVVTITVTPVNDAPVAVADEYTVDEDAVLTVLAVDGVLANDSDVDGDILTAILVSDVSHGILDLATDGSFVYTPADNYFGSDSFTYKANDGTLDSNAVTVSLTVNSVNDWVVANDDEYETPAGVTLEVAAPGVLTNDVLLDPNETVTLLVLVQPVGGTLTLNDDGSFTYVPDAGFFGVDTFEYQLNSAVTLQGEFSDTAIVTIKVIAQNIFLPLIFR